MSLLGRGIARALGVKLPAASTLNRSAPELMKARTSTRAVLGRWLGEDQAVHGYVSVVKNAGRPDEQIVCNNEENILTIAGRNIIHNRTYVDASLGSEAALDNIGLTTNTIDDTDDTLTSLAGEITSGGLERAEGTVTHANTGNTSNQTTITHTFDADAAHTGVKCAALFSATSGGTMGHVKNFTAVTLANGDTLTITWTITIS